MENIVIQTKLKTIPNSCTKCKYSYINNDGRFCSVKFVNGEHMKIPYEYVPEVNNYCYIKPEKDCPLKILENMADKEIEISQKASKFNPHDDKLFLLSETEYIIIRENIRKHCPLYKYRYWWLRSSDGYNSKCAREVSPIGGTFSDGVCREDCGVAVAFIEETHETIGTRKVKYDFPFIYVGNNLWISEDHIFWSRFDEKSNDYEKSEIRQKILKWAGERE